MGKIGLFLTYRHFWAKKGEDHFFEDVMLSFEQIESAMHKWAHRFQGRRFEHWELINAVWEMGEVQKLVDIRFASARIRYDMLVYIRETGNRRTRDRYKARGKFYPDATSLSLPLSEDSCLQDTLEVKRSPQFDDLLEVVLKGLSRTAKLVINLRYKCDYSFAEIGKVVGVTPSCICLIHREVLRRIGPRLTRMGENQGRCCRTGSFLYWRDTKGVNAYNREYYRKNKARIQERRKRKA